MKKMFFGCLISLFSMNIAAEDKVVTIKVVETTDVHGSFFPYDFINLKDKKGSLARIYTYVEGLRSEYGNNVLLLENGDLLQGQPLCYYYNYIATDQKNIGARVINFMKYDVQNFGNHDVETGHAVYDKWAEETNASVLGANIVDRKTGKCYVQPYEIFERDGVKIAVLGMLTAAIPSWLEEPLWSGLEFEEMVSSARKWITYLKQNEKPDVIIGLFHSGLKDGISTDRYEENVSERVAREVEGFDIIMYGHDHIKYCDTVKNTQGDSVWLLDPANNAMNVAVATIKVTINNGKVKSKHIAGQLVNVENLPVSDSYMSNFKDELKEINDYVSCRIGEFTEPMFTKDSFFGNSTFTDFIQNMQLSLTGADISFNAPLAFNAEIKKGAVRVADMFNLYKFENKLCVLEMTGEEICKHLEMSYSLWTNTMLRAADHIMLLASDRDNGNERNGFKNPTFNFDSAAGIDYEVDVTKPAGEKVKILRMSNGTPFDPHKTYKVAMNSYRANGGGELLTRGAGIPQAELLKRKVWQSERDLRYYLMQEIIKQGTIEPRANHNWHFVPEIWTSGAIARDRKLIFGE